MKAHYSFSVVVPARNEAKNIAACLESVWASIALQSEDAEVIVIDDCSADNTAILAEASGARVIRQSERAGPLEAWAEGLAQSDTPVIVFVDADCLIDSQALETIVAAIRLPGVGVASARSIPNMNDVHEKQNLRDHIARHSSRFSAVLLDELKNQLGDHDFIAIGRLMAIRREAWNITNTRLAHCDRQVAASARRAGWRVAWVPGAQVYYRPPLTYAELRADWLRTRYKMVHSAQVFDDIPALPTIKAAIAALFKTPICGLCWVACRVRLHAEVVPRRKVVETPVPFRWENES